MTECACSDYKNQLKLGSHSLYTYICMYACTGGDLPWVEALPPASWLHGGSIVCSADVARNQPALKPSCYLSAVQIRSHYCIAPKSQPNQEGEKP